MKELEPVWCPFYQGKSMCGANESGLYVPPKEVEFKYCTSKFSKCKRYKAAGERAVARKAGAEKHSVEEDKEREHPC